MTTSRWISHAPSGMGRASAPMEPAVPTGTDHLPIEHEGAFRRPAPTRRGLCSATVHDDGPVTTHYHEAARRRINTTSGARAAGRRSGDPRAAVDAGRLQRRVRASSRKTELVALASDADVGLSTASVDAVTRTGEAAKGLSRICRRQAKVHSTADRRPSRGRAATRWRG